jgi:hypothetical protein
MCGHYIVQLPILYIYICLCACVSNKPLSLCAVFAAEPQSYACFVAKALTFAPVLLQGPNSLCA